MNASQAKTTTPRRSDSARPDRDGPARLAFVEDGLRSWEGEARRYFDEVIEHSRATLEALARCENPIDVLAVEQAWVKARSEGYLDSGLRFANAFASVAQGLAAADDGQAVDDRAPPS
jgi:hypothetical protein